MHIGQAERTPVRPMSLVHKLPLTAASSRPGHLAGCAATGLSGRRGAHRRGLGALPLRSRLARSSLGLLALAMTTPACLVTSTPDFQPPKRTAPFLVAATAV